MANETNNQVHRSANGKWHVFWRGQVVYGESGGVLEFDTEHDASRFLDQCDAAGRIVHR
jgi:hypothetical protein